MTLILILSPLSAADAGAQIPTVHIPTVTGTDRGIVVTVRNDSANSQINLRGGPGTEYDRVGTMVIGQEATAIGRTEGGKVADRKSVV